jgi:hypothetical protein
MVQLVGEADGAAALRARVAAVEHDAGAATQQGAHRGVARARGRHRLRPAPLWPPRRGA